MSACSHHHTESAHMKMVIPRYGLSGVRLMICIHKPKLYLWVVFSLWILTHQYENKEFSIFYCTVLPLSYVRYRT